MKIITIANNKGGVGKTTFTWNLANILAKSKKKTLIIDLDNQISHLKNDREHLITFTDKLPPRQKTREYAQLCAKYDYILIDTPPSIHKSSQKAFILSDHVLLITDISQLSLDGIIKITNQYKDFCKNNNLDDNIDGIILNNLNNNNLTKIFVNQLEQDVNIKKILIKPYISKWTAFQKTTISGNNLYKIKNNKAIAIMELICQELENRKIL